MGSEVVSEMVGTGIAGFVPDEVRTVDDPGEGSSLSIGSEGSSTVDVGTVIVVSV